MFENEIIEKVKKENQGKRIFYGKIMHQTGTEGNKTVDFLIREPTITDAEMMQQMSQKNPIEASNNMLHSLIVHPEPAEVVSRLRPYPMAVAKFIDERINPFYGGNPTTEIQEL